MSRSRRTSSKKPRRMVPPSTPVVRVTTPAQMVASLPLQLGYTPTESLVVVCCHEPRGRTGLTMRVDLPLPQHEDALVAQVEGLVREQRATRVVMVIYTEQPDGELLPRAALMEALVETFSDLIVTEALLVRGGRFWSYVCEGKACCPPEGRPVDEAAGSAAIQVLQLEQLGMGAALVGTREDVARSFAGPTFLAAEEACQRFMGAAERYAELVADLGVRAARAEVLATWRAAVDEARDPRWQLPKDLAARLAAPLLDKTLRDGVAALWQEGDRTLRRLLEELARQTPVDFDAPVCTTLAWITYCEGGGSITNLALDRALASDPDYSMAQLLRHAMDNALPPSFVQGVTRRTRRALEQAA